MLRAIVYAVVRRFCIWFLWLHNGLRVEGKELIPTVRPLIFAANHVSNLDPIVSGCAVPFRLRFLAKEELFQMNKLFTWLLLTLGAVPVSRASGLSAAAALKSFLEILQSGESTMIFPEGSRSLDGHLQPVEGGVGLLAARTKVPIVPLYISGTFGAMPVGSKKIGRENIVVRFGNPIFPDQKSGLSPKEERERIRKELQMELETLEARSIG